MPAWSPHELNFALGETISPVANPVPLARFVGMMIDALALLIEAGEIVVLVIATHERGHHLPVFVHDAIGHAEAKLAGVKPLNRRDIPSGERQVLEGTAKTGPQLRF